MVRGAIHASASTRCSQLLTLSTIKGISNAELKGDDIAAKMKVRVTVRVVTIAVRASSTCGDQGRVG